jgi:hypothetical protein
VLTEGPANRSRKINRLQTRRTISRLFPRLLSEVRLPPPDPRQNQPDEARSEEQERRRLSSLSRLSPGEIHVRARGKLRSLRSERPSLPDRMASLSAKATTLGLYGENPCQVGRGSEN